MERSQVEARLSGKDSIHRGYFQQQPPHIHHMQMPGSTGQQAPQQHRAHLIPAQQQVPNLRNGNSLDHHYHHQFQQPQQTQQQLLQQQQQQLTRPSSSSSSSGPRPIVAPPSITITNNNNANTTNNNSSSSISVPLSPTLNSTSSQNNLNVEVERAKLLIPSRPLLPKSVQTKLSKTTNGGRGSTNFVKPTRQVPIPTPQEKMIFKTGAPVPFKADGMKMQQQQQQGSSSSKAPIKQNDSQLKQRKKFLEQMRAGTVGPLSEDGRHSPERAQFADAVPNGSSSSEDHQHHELDSVEGLSPRPASSSSPSLQQQQASLSDASNTIAAENSDAHSNEVEGILHDPQWNKQYRNLLTALGGEINDDEDDGTGDGLTQEEVEAFRRAHGTTPKTAAPSLNSIKFNSFPHIPRSSSAGNLSSIKGGGSDVFRHPSAPEVVYSNHDDAATATSDDSDESEAE